MQIGLGGKNHLNVLLYYVREIRRKQELFRGYPKKIGINLVSGLRYEGRAIVVVEHHMGAIRSLCDRCVVMNSGSKIAEGKPDVVLNEPEVVRAYLGEKDA